ncbi:hypothetical protein GLOIN_2v1774890 [Rhizophagus clarus]|uniref:Protein kinase domain-containing protein n=1 Tax=Rhizophagus clarus TaxID=94130 RepID=A0A8H3QD27_9GLOM|nr:hypothetical protein GLOIN_2v1774890 [Rhizophagus clarus]
MSMSTKSAMYLSLLHWDTFLNEALTASPSIDNMQKLEDSNDTEVVAVVEVKPEQFMINIIVGTEITDHGQVKLTSEQDDLVELYTAAEADTNQENHSTWFLKRDDPQNTNFYVSPMIPINQQHQASFLELLIQKIWTSGNSDHSSDDDDDYRSSKRQITIEQRSIRKRFETRFFKESGALKMAFVFMITSFSGESFASKRKEITGTEKRSAVDGLLAIHALGVKHGDIRLENIITHQRDILVSGGSISRGVKLKIMQ